MRKKQVWLEATHLFKSPTRNKSGIGNYTENIIKGVLDQENANNYHFSIAANLFFTNKKRYIAGIRSKDFSYLYSRFIPGKVWNQLLKRKLMPPIEFLHLKKPDAVVNFDFTAIPTAKKVKNITVVYDLSFLKFRKYSDSKNAEYLTKEVPKSVHKSDIIVTISENSKKEILDEYDVDSKKIKVINPGIDHNFFTPRDKTEIEIVKKKYGINTNYILYTGTIEPRKNIDGILDAYSKLPENIKNSYSLVLAGGKGWLDRDIHQKLEKLSNLNIIMTGYVDYEDLPALYSGATLFIYPSFYEGFGMPPAEAMACGTPVVTSNNSALPEVVGKAGIMVDASDTLEIRKSIEKIINDKNLQKELIKKGYAQARKFSWEDSSRKMIDVIEEVLKR